MTGSGAEPPPTRLGRLRRLLRIEDLLLVGWTVLVAPILFRSSEESVASDEPDRLFGFLALIAVAGGIACLVTRTRGAPPLNIGEGMSPSSYARFPFMAALMLVGAEGAGELDLDWGDAIVGPIFLVTMGAFLLDSRLPEVGAMTRRAFVGPMVIGAGAIFDRIIFDIGELFDLRILTSARTPEETTLLAVLLPLMLGALLAFYVMLVFAPRQVAEAEGSWLAWAFRFALFVAAVSVGATWRGMIGG